MIFCKSVKPGENRPLLWSTCETKLGHLFYSSRLDSDESEICNKQVNWVPLEKKSLAKDVLMSFFSSVGHSMSKGINFPYFKEN